MTEIEQWIKDHEASLGYHSKRLTAPGTVMFMSMAELEDAILNSRSGLITAARKERDRRVKENTDNALKAYVRASQLGGEHTVSVHERNPQYDEKGRRFI